MLKISFVVISIRRNQDHLEAGTIGILAQSSAVTRPTIHSQTNVTHGTLILTVIPAMIFTARILQTAENLIPTTLKQPRSAANVGADTSWLLIPILIISMRSSHLNLGMLLAR